MLEKSVTTQAVDFPSTSNRVSTYDESMSAHVIGNPVPTPEEMAQILGLSSERVAAVRRIMSAPTKRKSSKGANSLRGIWKPGNLETTPGNQCRRRLSAMNHSMGNRGKPTTDQSFAGSASA